MVDRPHCSNSWVVQNQTTNLDIGFGSNTGTYNLAGGIVSAGTVNVNSGLLNVTGSAVLTVKTALTCFAGSMTNLSGGTINTPNINLYAIPSLLNWTSGTLNITSNVTFDASASSVTTGAAFGPSLSLGNGQTFMISANESLGGVGTFSLSLNPGSVHEVTGTLTLNPTGTLTQYAGSTLYAAIFNQAGGTVNGTIQNQGIFNYQSGLFNGRLLNQGVVNLGPTFVAQNGIENDTAMIVIAGQTLTMNGQGLDNLGTFNLSGGYINGTGSVLNDYGGTMYITGTISSAFTNNGLLSLTGVTRFNGAAVNNGTLTGSGTIIGAFSNPLGLINVVSSIAISNLWANAGLVNVVAGGTLGGGAITNTGTIQGAGTISSTVANTTGVIRANAGQLILNGTSDTNSAGAQIQAPTGGTVLYLSGLGTNGGTIALAGGIFDNNNLPMTNTGNIEGNGTLRTGGLTNTATILLSDNASTVYGPIINSAGANIKIVSNTTTFYGNVTNNGAIKVTGGVARFLGNGVSMTVGGTYNSDPSDNYFSGLTTTSTGTVTGGSDDRFFLIDSTAFSNAGTFANGGTLSANIVFNTGSFTQTGTLVETANFTNSGTTLIGGVQNWSSGAVFTNTAGTAVFNSDAGVQMPTLSVVATGGSINFTTTEHLALLNISSGATASVAKSNGQPTIIFTPILAVSGKLDLGANDLDAQSANSLAAITTMVRQGYNNGQWNGAGIISSTAAANTQHLTTLGVIQNNQSGTALFTRLQLSMAPRRGSGDILIKYTYYGDANLDGKVDASDYSLIDSGFITHATGWFNGDFNYDGLINGSDYTLIDNAFNTQGAQLTAEVATTSAQIAAASSVPEPASVALAGIAAIALLGRRRSGNNARR